MQLRRTLGFLFACWTTCALASAQNSPDFVTGRSHWENQEGGIRWRINETLMQGYFGISNYSTVEVTGGPVDGDEGDLDQLPVIGGGAQWKLGGERMDLGVEGMLSFSGLANVAAFAAGGSGAVVAVDVDLMVFELYGGPFASVFLGEKLRLYGAAGPLMQFVDYSQTGSGTDEDGSGVGSGWYARAGLEMALPSRSFLGLGVRWSDTDVDLGDSLGDLEMDGLQIFITLSRGI